MGGLDVSGHYPGQQQPSPVGYSVPSYPEQSRATAVFVLGLMGMLVFPLLAPFAWTMGNRELAAIDAGRRPPDNRQLARIGQILGIAISLLLILLVALLFGLVLVSL
ncbi:MAG: hypothetical protein WBM50_07860 [Acidimicrobiales bacterium]